MAKFWTDLFLPYDECLKDIEKDSQFLKLQGRKYPVTLCEGRKPRLLQKG